MREQYAMYTPAGDRLIANRINTVRKKLDAINKKTYENSWRKAAEIQHVIATGVKGYANMKSKVHREYSDTAVRETVLGEFEKIYMEAMGCDRSEAGRFIDKVWYSVR